MKVLEKIYEKFISFKKDGHCGLQLIEVMYAIKSDLRFIGILKKLHAKETKDHRKVV